MNPPEIDLTTNVVLAIVAIVAVVATIAYVAHRIEQQRREAMFVLATQLGFTFDAEPDYTLAWPYEAFSLFTRGHSRRAYNTLGGQLSIEGRAYPARMGDFLYKITSGSGKNRRTTTYRISYLLLELPFRSMPSLTVRPEGFFDKLAGVIGFPDINFESGEFSRCFHVKSSDQRFAYDLIDPRMIEFLLATRPMPIHIDGRACCISNDAGRWKPEHFVEQIEFAKQFFARIPDHVVKTLTPVDHTVIPSEEL